MPTPDFSEFTSPKKMTSDQNIMPVIQSTKEMLDDYAAVLSLNDQEQLKTYVRRNWPLVIDACMEKGSNMYAITVITSDQFLSTLRSMISSSDIIFDPDRVVKFNKICYDFDRMYNRPQEILNMMIDIVFENSRQIAQTLMGFNLNRETASKLIAARYSTLDTRVSFKRVIRVIQQQPKEIMTEQTIVDIFGKICLSPVTDLFIAMMFDVYDGFNSSEQNYVYSTVSNAVLDVVESLPNDGIIKVLSTYLNMKAETNSLSRFMLKSINIGDYPRINKAIDQLEFMGYMIY